MRPSALALLLSLAACGRAAPAVPRAGAVAGAVEAEPLPAKASLFFAEPDERAVAVTPFDLVALRERLTRGEVSGFVVAAPSARLFASADEARAADGAAAPIPAIDTASARGGGEEGVLLAVVADHGDLVEADSVATTRGHCSQAEIPSALLHFAVRLFVRKRDLVPVIARPLEIPFPDGTGVSLAAGASLGPPKHPWRGEPAVAASGFAFEVPLRQEDVALSYQPSAFDHDVDPPSIVTPPTAFRWRGRPFYRPSGYDRTPIIPNGEIVEMRARCVVLFLRSDTPVALDRRGGGAGGIGGLGRRREPKTVKVTHRYMRPGATVVWDDGSVAGRVRDRLRLGKQVERGGRPCWEDERLAHGGFLCLPPASIETVEEEVTVR